MLVTLYLIAVAQGEGAYHGSAIAMERVGTYQSMDECSKAGKAGKGGAVGGMANPSRAVFSFVCIPNGQPSANANQPPDAN
jgi:hypothetical protein